MDLGDPFVNFDQPVTGAPLRQEETGPSSTANDWQTSRTSPNWTVSRNETNA